MRLVKQLSLLLISPKRLNGLSSKGRGLYFGGRWVVATFLKLLSSNLVYPEKLREGQLLC